MIIPLPFVCILLFFHYFFHVLAVIRYKILAASKIKDSFTPEKAAQVILDHIQLDPEQYRMGKTKVQFNKTQLYFALITNSLITWSCNK